MDKVAGWNCVSVVVFLYSLVGLPALMVVSLRVRFETALNATDLPAKRHKQSGGGEGEGTGAL